MNHEVFTGINAQGSPLLSSWRDIPSHILEGAEEQLDMIRSLQSRMLSNESMFYEKYFPLFRSILQRRFTNKNPILRDKHPGDGQALHEISVAVKYGSLSKKDATIYLAAIVFNAYGITYTGSQPGECNAETVIRVIKAAAYREMTSQGVENLLRRLSITDIEFQNRIQKLKREAYMVENYWQKFFDQLTHALRFNPILKRDPLYMEIADLLQNPKFNIQESVALMSIMNDRLRDAETRSNVRTIGH